MALLLAGDAEPFPTLRRQWAVATIAGRSNHATWGMIATLHVPASEPRVEPARFDIGDVSVEFASAPTAGYASFFVVDGVLAELNLVNWVGPWRAGAVVRSVGYLRTVLPQDDSGDAEFIAVPVRDWDGVWQNLEEARSWVTEPPN